jgi:hypothetical protein
MSAFRKTEDVLVEKPAIELMAQMATPFTSSSLQSQADGSESAVCTEGPCS